MALAIFIGTDIALLSVFFAATAALGLVLGRALKTVREASEVRTQQQARNSGVVALDASTNAFRAPL